MRSVFTLPVRRRAFVVGSLCLALPSCDSNPVLRNFVRLGTEVVAGPPPLPLSRDDITKLPYATMSAKIGRSPESLLVLGRVERQDLHWVSSDSGIVVTRGGRIVKTVGFSENLRNTRAPAPDPVDKRLHRFAAANAPFIRYLDFDIDRYFGLEVHSYFRTLGTEKIDILDISFDVVHVVEKVAAQTISWTFENHFWVDPADGYVWKSQQHFVRSLPPLEFSVLKPPAA